MTTKTPKAWQKNIKLSKKAPKDTKKKKNNWKQMRLLYLDSKIESLQEFLLKEYGLDYNKSSYFRKMTKGWSKEKKSMQKEAFEVAKKEVEKEIKDKLVENYKIPIKQLNSMKSAWFDLLTAFLQSEASKISTQTNPETGAKEMLVTGWLDIQKIVKVLEKVKIEMWEPITITENQLWKEEKEIARGWKRITAIKFK